MRNSVVQVDTSSVHVFLIFFVFSANKYHTHTHFMAIFQHFPWLAGSPHPQMTMTQTVTAMKLTCTQWVKISRTLEFIGITMPYFKNELSTLYVLPTRQRTQTWSRGRQGHSNEVFQILWSRHDTQLFFPAAIEAARTWNQLVTALVRKSTGWSHWSLKTAGKQSSSLNVCPLPFLKIFTSDE